MPVTLKQSQLLYNNGNNQYQGIDTIAQRSTAQMVSQIQAAGTSTITQVQGKINQLQTNFDTIKNSIQSTLENGTDTTLTQSGVAADAKAAGDAIGDLKSAFNSYFTPTDLAANATYTASYYVDYTNGTNKAGSSYKASDYIDISGSVKIVYTRLYTTSSISPAGIAFYDENKAFISGSGIQAAFNQSTDHFEYKTAVVPAGAKYVRCSGKRQGALASAKVEVYDEADYNAMLPNRMTAAETAIADTSQRVNDLDSYILPTNLAANLTYTQSYFINYQTGSPTANSYYKVTNLIDISGCQGIVYSRLYTSSSTSNAGIAFYDENGTFITDSGIPAVFNNAEDSFVLEEATVPNGAKYIRCSSKKTLADADVVIYDAEEYKTVLSGRVLTLEKKVDNGIGYQAYAMDDVLCIGDSLTAGSCYRPNGTWIGNIKQCYPYFLGRFLRCDVTNAGHGGKTAKTWYNNYFSSFTYTDYNTVIIFLGTNGGLTDTIDTDVPGGGVYGDTNTGYYCRMIEEIRAANPECQIFLVNVFSAATGSAETKTTIRKVGAKYSLPVIETLELATAKAPEYHGWQGNVHLSKMGYCYLAHKIANFVADWIGEDITRGDFGRNKRDEEPDS